MPSKWRFIAIILVFAMVLTQSAEVLAAGEKEFSYENELIPSGDVNNNWEQILSPTTNEAGVSTWDCIWFGNYWQTDTNGDGYCFSKDTTVSKDPKGDFIDENGDALNNFSGNTGFFNADIKMPVKWRVLSIDDDGKALLLSDKLIDVAPYNVSKTDETCDTWKESSLRSYLNGYNSIENKNGLDYSGNGFIDNAFSDPEKSAIIEDTVVNDDTITSYYNTVAGDDTTDKIFCLSLAEVSEQDHGFLNSDYDDDGYSEEDPTRTAITTQFVSDKPGHSLKKTGSNEAWWLRSPGFVGKSFTSVSFVGSNGDIDAFGIGAQCQFGIRPALKLDLSSYPSLWNYAGTVSSDGKMTQVGLSVVGISLPKQRIIKVGSSLTLTPAIIPADAEDQRVSWSVVEGSSVTVDQNGKVSAVAVGTSKVQVMSVDGGFTDTCEIMVVEDVDISAPNTSGEKTIWDCIWFGEYWQNSDTNGDGKVGRDDEKDPIKWRVLNVDSSGNALLLSDRLIDIVEYNPGETEITWKYSTIRSFLNSYGNQYNTYGSDYTSTGFLDNAFSSAEKAFITDSRIINSLDPNPEYDVDGGEDTEDKIFCLSIAEATDPTHGFRNNTFTDGYTNADPARKCLTTGFAADKSDYGAEQAGKPDSWWLRSPGESLDVAAMVTYTGSIDAEGLRVGSPYCCVRPALYIDLASSMSFWKYAGTVCSDGTMVQEGLPVKEITLPGQRTLKTGRSVTLTPEIIPADASDQSLNWSILKGTSVTVDDNGTVTAVAEGTSTVQVKTTDGRCASTCVINVVPAEEVAEPMILDGKTTWDCIWFGEYWQESDSNKDGKVTQDDIKDPIKWRVLEIDSSGNALLLSDKLLDLVEFNGIRSDNKWKNSTIRSFLNSYDRYNNSLYRDYSSTGFLNNAFSSEEEEAIVTSFVSNSANPNPVYHVDGGEDTNDKVFCLSIAESMSERYGFLNNEFTGGGDPYCKTNDDPSRAAVITAYANNSASDSPDSGGSRWWLRSVCPGYDIAYVGLNGSVSAGGCIVDYDSGFSRPALRVNLSYSDLWSYAGTVCSDGTVVQKDLPEKSVFLPKQKTIKIGSVITLTPEIFPATDDDLTVSWSVVDGTAVKVSGNGVVTAVSEGTATVQVKTDDGGATAECEISVVSSDNVADPVITDGTTTWDCIWFGAYWQSSDTKKDYIINRNDAKDAIKWRVLDVDSSGNALLLSDKLLDVIEYNKEDVDITWEQSTIRSFLNCYDDSHNMCGTDCSSTGFLNNAFSSEERGFIEDAAVSNSIRSDPMCHVDGGNDTIDKIFCLSIAEVTDPDHGFTNNDFSNGITEGHFSRRAYSTDYAYKKPGYHLKQGVDPWWLRSPGINHKYAAYVDGSGSVKNDIGFDVDAACVCVRPAMRINLASCSSLWDYAGTVRSDNTTDQVGPFAKGVSIPEQKIIKIGKSVTLTPQILPADANDRTVSWNVLDGTSVTVDEKGTVTALSKGTATIQAKTTEGGFTDTCKITVVATDEIASPLVQKEITWDCIWFGEYWQEMDSNKDGKVTQEDVKEPIKWRVLDIDSSGNALLLSDKLLDVIEYNEEETDITWKDATIRSFLNCYDDKHNRSGINYTETGFLNNAFTSEEKMAITDSELSNAVNSNPVYPLVPGGDDTKDKIFCLSIAEITEPDYGFLYNIFSGDYTYKDDPSRVSVTTRYTSNKLGNDEGSAGSGEWWWLRSPGRDSGSVADVNWYGSIFAGGNSVSESSICVRPALRVNLKSCTSLWKYAGTVMDDGTVTQQGRSVKSVSLTDQRTIKVGSSITLNPMIMPADADDKTVSWRVVEGTSVEVDGNGTVTAVSEGNATVQVETTDGGYTDTCQIRVVPSTEIADPMIVDGKTTWDCVWFGKYRQDSDTNISEEDQKDAIKWRVLDVDACGNALLLSDRLLDVIEYNAEDKDTTWNNSTIRSFLNNYDGSYNDSSVDFTSEGFYSNAFSLEERIAIKESEVNDSGNPNPVYSTVDGGKDTRDKIFCLSISEATDPDYGFLNNSITGDSTDIDDSRVAYSTGYTFRKLGHDENEYDTTRNEEPWWLRSPGFCGSCAACVDPFGAVDAYGYSVNARRVCVRPAMQMNLASYSSLWYYAGTVCSDGSEDEKNPPEENPPEEDPPEEPDEETDPEDNKFTMLPGEVRRLNVSKNGMYVYGVKYESSDPKLVSVKNGVVTAKKLKKGETQGKAVVTASYGGIPIEYEITVEGSNPAITVGGKGKKITATKTVNAVVGKDCKVTVNLPKALRGKTVSPNMLDYDCFVLGTQPVIKGAKVTYSVTPREAGAAYIIWTVTGDDGVRSQAFSKVIVKKPIEKVSVSQNGPVFLEVGQGARIPVITTEGNTDPKDLSFKASGKGIKVSKSGYVVAAVPGVQGRITVKAGKCSAGIDVVVKDHDGEYLTISKPSVSIPIPKPNAKKDKKVALKYIASKKSKPTVRWELTGLPENEKRISIDPDTGVVTVAQNAPPGCYTAVVKADGYNSACCELIIK